jgi:50S ribosomal subunit-associated GTPase HflX
VFESSLKPARNDPSLMSPPISARGKAEMLFQLAREHEADVILFDVELNPVQQRNLEQITQTRVD